jgi:3-methyladenine DNA glycosylase AlkD
MGRANEKRTMTTNAGHRENSEQLDLGHPEQVAFAIDAELRALPVLNTPNGRGVRRAYTLKLRRAEPRFVLDVARELIRSYGHRWLAYELIRTHQAAFRSVGQAELEEIGQGVDSWGTVDSFARTLSGPAWLRGQVPDQLIHRWACSPDRWWRRAALVSTVALNVRSEGGPGDVPRTLEVCRLLIADSDDTVVKALSWALRELVVHDPDAVGRFLDKHDSVLAARVKREVRNKLTTGRKSPGAERKRAG